MLENVMLKSNDVFFFQAGVIRKFSFIWLKAVSGNPDYVLELTL